MRRSPHTEGMTLLEILIALSLMVVLLGFVWGMVTVFSTDYLAGEKRVSRAQLVRSVSQMLSDDLGAAVQDPIHPLDRSAKETFYVRRFGLRGDAVSLQIDVVQPNLLVETASLAENRAAAGSSSKPARPQVPELKTVFYEFVAPNAAEKRAAPGGAGGAVLTPARKYGLSRKELSYEAPENGSPDPNAAGMPNAAAGAVAPPSPPQAEEPLSAAQLALLIDDDNAVWIPEVVDFRLRYFDGSRWYPSWDSIKRNSLPTAIEADIKLMPLDDVEELRASPLLPRLVYPPNRFDGYTTPAAPGGALTLESAAEALKLSPVMTRRVVARIPITPLAQHRSPARRKPLPTVKGEAGSQSAAGSASRAAGSGDSIGGRNVVGSGDLFPTAGSLPGEEESFGSLFAPGQAAPPSPFGRVDSLLSGFEPAADAGFEGMTAAPAGTPVPTETERPASAPTGIQQGWLRGGR